MFRRGALKKKKLSQVWRKVTQYSGERHNTRCQSVNTSGRVNNRDEKGDREKEGEGEGGEREEKQTACAMWVKLTPLFPGG